MKNKIPRKFYRITVEMLINTSEGIKGDICHIFKNRHGYFSLNTRTGKYADMFLSMLRNAEIIKITEITTW